MSIDYEEFEKLKEIDIATFNKSRTNFGRIRILLFLSAQVVVAHSYFIHFSIFSIMLIFVIFSLFCWLLIKSAQLKKLTLRYEAEIKVYKRYLARLDGSWMDFDKTGEEYIGKAYHNNDILDYSYDLDIFGRASLFQYINETNTYYGKESLKELLDGTIFYNPLTLIHFILERRQKAVKELSVKEEFCRNFKIEGILSEDISANPEKLVEFFEKDATLFSGKYIQYLFSALPIIAFSFLGLSFIVLPHIFLNFFLILLIVQGFLFASYSEQTDDVLKQIYGFKKSIANFCTMIDLVKNEDFVSDHNKYNKELLTQTSDKAQLSASTAMKSLKNISFAVYIRHSTILYLALNIFLLWDLNCLFALERLKARGVKNISSWLKTIGDFESLISIALLTQLHPDWDFPTISNELKIEATDMSHPLINEQERISNSFNLDNISIISSSNMSGKTTFLRTLGINLVLAYAGAPVCATKFSTPLLKIYTSMGITDDLSQNISTFYAELLRIKKMIDASKAGAPMIFLIDEIFRGTNSKDRVIGAKQVLLQLKKHGVIGMITTHDLEVCGLTADHDWFSNYHFSEYYEGDKICFDYKIKDGISTTSNAQYLMRIVGIEMDME